MAAQGLDARFVEAQSVAKTLKNSSTDNVRQLYSHYKQATKGPAMGARPSAFNVMDRMKFDAWSSLGSMDQAKAKEKYIEIVERLVPSWKAASSTSPSVGNPLHVAGATPSPHQGTDMESFVGSFVSFDAAWEECDAHGSQGHVGAMGLLEAGKPVDPFERSQQIARNLTDVRDEDRLQFYALYKQATVGHATGERPSATQVEACVKFGSWVALGMMSQQDAKERYMLLVDRLSPGWRQSPEPTEPLPILLGSKPLIRAKTENLDCIKPDKATSPKQIERRGTWTLGSDRKTPQIGNGEYEPGCYTLVADAILGSAPRLDSDNLAFLKQGSSVNILKVVTVGHADRIRGQVEAPAGWISLASLDSRMRWVSRKGVFEYHPGCYTLTSDRILGRTAALDSEDIQWLKAGSAMNVLSLVYDEKCQRIRGQVDDPAGWVSLATLDGSERWAHRKSDAMFQPGPYTLAAHAIVSCSAELESTEMQWLKEGANVNIVSVVRLNKDGRIRGQVECPAGWISLASLDSSHIWAKPQQL